jgi:hypothetical protein
MPEDEKEIVAVIVRCCLCSKDTSHEIELPKGWVHRGGEIEDELDGLCPDHAAVADFANSQCSGCVGSFGDCDMFRAFSYARSRDVSEADYAKLRQGVCPRRTGGTFSMTMKKENFEFETIDLSSKSVEGGVAFAAAIEKYCVD